MAVLGPSSIVIFGLFAASPLLSKNTSYLWPLQLVATDIMFIPIIFSVTNSSNDDTSSKYSKNYSTGSRSSKCTQPESNQLRSGKIVAVSTPETVDCQTPKILGHFENSKFSVDKVAPDDLEESQ